MIVYLDASALVKLYVDEEASADVRRWCADVATAFATFDARQGRAATAEGLPVLIAP